MNDHLSWVEELRLSRKEKIFGKDIFFLKETDSTNLQARRDAMRGAEEGRIILAESQSQGRGRRGRAWESPPGVNLYFSLLLRPFIPLAKAPQITLLAGVAGANALSKISGLEARIKWPNDIMIHGKKVGGILSEAEAEDSRIRFIILGVGINVNWRKEDWPAELGKTATSLFAETKREISRARVAAQFFEEWESRYCLFQKEGWSPLLCAEWNRLSWVNGKNAVISMLDEKFSGQVLGLDTDGALLLMSPGGKTQRFIAGDVSLRV
jgi:BirA family transcriptional regulator, biotin operon repressor / biotin---[acetyl-CoA-carboxylase] ligase